MRASRTIVSQQNALHASQMAKSNLKNIIELTEEQDTVPNATNVKQVESTSQTKIQRPLIQESWKCLKYCMNLWRYFCKKQHRLELDVSDAQFANVITEIRNKKSFYTSVLPQQKQKRRVLVLDLDETLIHTSFIKPAKCDFQIEVPFNGRMTKIYTIKRFGLEAFLFEMSQIYQIVVFTASQKIYADKVIDIIDPKRRISHRLYREHCIVINKTYYLKNLKILGRSLDQTLIVDDNNIAGLLHPDNFYKIAAFDGNDKDRQLCRLSSFLKHLHNQSSMVPVNQLRKKFQEMEINLQQVVLGQGGRSINDKKKQYKHKKANSQIQSLTDKIQQSQEVGQTTATQIMRRNL